jgi:hypothetical protein
VVDKSKREDGTFSRSFYKDQNIYICPARKILTTTGKLVNDGDTLLIEPRHTTAATASSRRSAVQKVPLRRIPRDIYKKARQWRGPLAKTEAFERSRRDSKRIAMLLAHLKRTFRLSPMRLRGPCGVEFTLAAMAQNLRRLAKLVDRPRQPPTRALRE